MHGLDVEPANPIQVAVAGLESRSGLEVRHSNVAGEIVDLRGIPATSVCRTLLDLCAWSPSIEALVAIDMAVRMRLTSPGNLRHYASGKRVGAFRLRSLAEVAAPAESPMETRLRWLLLGSGLPKPRVQADLYNDAGNFIGRADLYYPSAHLVIEFDGRNHQDRLVSDLRRQNALQHAGYKIFRFTAADVYGRPDEIIALVAAALNNRLPSSILA